MAFKFVALLSILAAANAGLLPAQQSYHGHGGAQIYQQQPLHAVASLHAAPAYHHGAAAYAAPAYHHGAASYAAPALVKHVEIEKPANYEFSYSVHDEHTGDIKQQHETRHGDQVQGQYSLLDSDGHHRIVDYSADAHNGFNAVVRREPTGIKVATHQAKILAPVAHHAAPLALHSQQIHAAPLAHSAHLVHSAPLVHSQQIHAAPLSHSSHLVHSAPLVHSQQIHSAPLALHSQQIHAAPLAHSAHLVHSAPLVHSQQLHAAPLLHSGLNAHSAGHAFSSQHIVHHDNHHQAYHH